MDAGEPVAKTPASRNICIAGLTAAGKTTHAHLLAGHFGLIYVSASQLLLSASGRSPIQRRDFWVGEEGRALWRSPAAAALDESLARIEETVDGAVFDTRSMPWTARRPALKIWLESSVESRVMKAMISHRESARTTEECRRLLREKDGGGIDDRRWKAGTSEPFDLVLDLSGLITAPDARAALASIAAAQALLLPAAAYYLIGDKGYLDEFRRASAAAPGVVQVDRLERARRAGT